jgi:hypothetical protein
MFQKTHLFVKIGENMADMRLTQHLIEGILKQVNCSLKSKIIRKELTAFNNEQHKPVGLLSSSN